MRERRGVSFCYNFIFTVIHSAPSRVKQLFLRQGGGREERVKGRLASYSIFHLSYRAMEVGIQLPVKYEN
jgi:hypothetical protein